VDYQTEDRVEVTIINGNYPNWRWVRRGKVVAAYPNSVHVRFDDTGIVNAYTLPMQAKWVRKLSLLELIAEAAQ